MEAIKNFFRTIYNNKQAFVGMCIFIFLCLVAIFGPMIVELDLTDFDFMNRYQPPSLAHPFGTDFVGNDLFSQIIHGASDIIFIGILASFFLTVMGFTLGTLAGFVGGAVDSVISLIADVLVTIPGLPIQLIIVAIFPFRGLVATAFVLSILSWGGMALAIRGQVMSLKQRDFVLICRIMGLSKFHIVFKEILPNITALVIMMFVTGIHGAINGSVALMMLGMVAMNPTNWVLIQGNAFSHAAGGMNTAALWNVAVPVLAFFILQLSLVMFATGLDEALNPRLRAAKRVKKPKKQRTQVTGGAASGA